MRYGHVGTFRVRPGHRRGVVDRLVEGSERLRRFGCLQYAVCEADDDEDGIVVLELWESRTHHDASLADPAVRAGIAETMPLLTGEFGSRALTVVGGLGT